MLERRHLRKTLLAKRRALTPIEQEQASLQLTRILVNTVPFLASQNIAIYYALSGEINPALLLSQAGISNKTYYLPILAEQHLEFGRYNLNDPLQLNHHNIPEPVTKNLIASHELDLVIVPLIGFDLQGNRLGTGGGYYDRTFAFLQEQKRFAKPYLLGIAYEWQRLDKIPSETWDVKLDAIATEKQLYLV